MVMVWSCLEAGVACPISRSYKKKSKLKLALKKMMTMMSDDKWNEIILLCMEQLVGGTKRKN
jgi:hypothetical protein